MKEGIYRIIEFTQRTTVGQNTTIFTLVINFSVKYKQQYDIFTSIKTL